MSQSTGADDKDSVVEDAHADHGDKASVADDGHADRRDKVSVVVEAKGAADKTKEEIKPPVPRELGVEANVDDDVHGEDRVDVSDFAMGMS